MPELDHIPADWDALIEELKQLQIRQSEKNPLFIFECQKKAKELREAAGLSQGEADKYRLYTLLTGGTPETEPYLDFDRDTIQTFLREATKEE